MKISGTEQVSHCALFNWVLRTSFTLWVLSGPPTLGPIVIALVPVVTMILSYHHQSLEIIVISSNMIVITSIGVDISTMYIPLTTLSSMQSQCNSNSMQSNAIPMEFQFNAIQCNSNVNQQKRMPATLPFLISIRFFIQLSLFGESLLLFPVLAFRPQHHKAQTPPPSPPSELVPRLGAGGKPNAGRSLHGRQCLELRLWIPPTFPRPPEAPRQQDH